MRRSFLLVAAAVAALSFLPTAARSSVLISELCDPLEAHYLTDRFIEIYNSGPDSVDLTNWALIAVGNGVDIMTWHLSGTIVPGQALVAGNSTTFAVFTVNFPDAAWSTSNSTWNGRVNDGAKLVNGSGSVIDRVVVGGTVFENSMYVRNPNIYSPNPTYTPAEWTATPVTLSSDANPGTHTVLPRPPGPSISQIVTSPAFPLAGTPTDVHADVVDTASAITAVTLAWGTSASALSNSIPMTLLSGATYATSAAIPAQVAGTTVFYKVTATDAAAGASTTDLRSYALFYDLTIAQIQGAASASPYAGSGAITQGVVTGRFGTYFTVQDGTGAWNGLWARATTAPAVGDVVTVRGTVIENDAQGYAGNTLLASAVVMSATPGGTLPAPVVVPSGSALAEAYEGVLVKIAGGVCANPSLGAGQWSVNDGSGAAVVDPLGYVFTPLLGTTYDITGPVNYSNGAYKLEPRDAADVVWAADLVAPSIVVVGEMSESTFLVQFSEPLEQTSAENPANYSIAGIAASAAVRDPSNPAHVLITVAGVPARLDTVIATGVADPYANATVGARGIFTYTDVAIPPGYYDGTAGLKGAALRLALHNLIKNHAAQSYDYAYTAFQTTDVKPNGKVWDVYSDIPGGTPPYEFVFGQTGGTSEGDGYNREHSWPQAWFGGALPMYSDLWILYPTDVKVNEHRSNYPYGPVAAATFTSMNGTKLGTSADPAYVGTVFEPIDAFKGDLARSAFYVATRYYTEDAGWPGSASASGADLLPWAAYRYTQWSLGDPVSWKERLRNGAIYTIQNNRNPFVDHPEFGALIFDSTSVTAADGAAVPAFRLLQNAPNPFRDATAIRFDLARRERVQLSVYDITGRRVRTLLRGGVLDPGRHEAVWDGRDDAGSRVGAGLFFCRLDAGARNETRRVVRIR